MQVSVQNRWLPIESAPKDGTVIRLRRIHEGQLIAEGNGFWGRRDETFKNVDPDDNFKWWIRECGQYVMPTPTEWRPL